MKFEIGSKVKFKGTIVSVHRYDATWNDVIKVRITADIKEDIIVDDATKYNPGDEIVLTGTIRDYLRVYGYSIELDSGRYTGYIPEDSISLQIPLETKCSVTFKDCTIYGPYEDGRYLVSVYGTPCDMFVYPDQFKVE